MGAGWFWDAGNGFGFAAFAGLLYLGITSYQRTGFRAHQLLGYTVLAIAVVHVLWFLLGDAAVVEYIKIGAPVYMWAGIFGLVLLFVLVTIAVVPDRQKVHKNYPAFRHWHRLLAIIAIASSAFHIVVSHFYLATWYQATLFIALATAPFGRAWWIKVGRLPIVTPAALLLVVVLFVGLFSAIRNLSL